MHGEGVFAGLGWDLKFESVVPVGPIAYVAAIYIDMRFGHGTVEDELGIIIAGRDGELCAVPAFANPRQTARTSGLLGGFLLTVLLDADYLFVDILIERALDGPIVWDGDLLPAGIVEVGGFGTCHGTVLEAPA